MLDAHPVRNDDIYPGKYYRLTGLTSHMRSYVL